jgi:ABC-type Co2+ transport system permease subunit
MNNKMNSKWKWVLGITQAMIIVLIPLLVLALIFQDGGNGILGVKTLIPAWLIMMAWVVVVIFGFSEEG